MANWNGFPRIIVIFGTLVFVAVLGAAAHGDPIEPILKDPVGQRYCSTEGDTAKIGIGTAVDLGDATAVPVYVGSDDNIETWRFLFDLPVEVDDVSQVWVEAAGWPYEIDELWIDDDGYLVVERSIGAGSSNPDLEDVFFTLYISTHCWKRQDEDVPVVWGPPGDPRDPDIFLGVENGCSRDPLECLEDGSFYINPIVIMTDISEEIALIGDEVVVTVTCENDYIFRAFFHYIQFDPNVLTMVAPFVDPTDRCGGHLGYHQPQPDQIALWCSNPNGCGTSDEDGPVLYTLHFKCISPVEDAAGAIGYFHSTYYHGLDCNQVLNHFADIISDTGSVTVPVYQATFDIYGAMISNDDLDEFHVPLYLKNNYRIFEFRLPVRYADDPDDPLEFIGFESADPSEFVGFGQICQEYRDDEYKYAVLMTQGLTEIDTSSEFRYIGDLIFQNTVPRPGVTAFYYLQFLDIGCHGEYDNWVHTWDDVRGETEYGWSDPQTTFWPGSIYMCDPTVWISPWIALGSMEGDPWEADSRVRVRSNVALDEVTFKVAWTPDEFCVTAHDILENAEVVVNEAELEAAVSIVDVEPSSYYIDYAYLLFENATHDEQTGDLDIIDVNVVETNPSGRLRVYPFGGYVRLDGVPVGMLTCIETVGMKKEAAVPQQFELKHNYPNPFNASTTIEFAIPEAAQTTLEVYNVMGQRVVTLVNTYTEAGRYSVYWDGRDARGSTIASGIYLYRLQSGQYLDTKKMVLMK